MSVLLCSWLDCNRNTYMDQKLQPPLSFNLSSLCIIIWTSLVTQMVKHLPRTRKTQVQSLGWEDLLEKDMATHSSTLVWKMPWTEEPGRLQSMGLQRVRHGWATSLTIIILSWAVTRLLHFSQEKSQTGTSLVVQWLRLRLPMQRVQIRCLVRDLRSHMPRGQKTKTKHKTQKHYCNRFNKLLKNGPLQRNKI